MRTRIMIDSGILVRKIFSFDNPSHALCGPSADQARRVPGFLDDHQLPPCDLLFQIFPRTSLDPPL